LPTSQIFTQMHKTFVTGNQFQPNQIFEGKASPLPSVGAQLGLTRCL